MNLAQQLPLDLRHRPAHGRDDFLITPNNEKAVSWIDNWPDWPAPAVILYGPAACGKTHLAAVWKDKTGAHSVDMSDFAQQDANHIAAKALCGTNINPLKIPVIQICEFEAISFRFFQTLLVDSVSVGSRCSGLSLTSNQINNATANEKKPAISIASRHVT